jgi:hypothetical protein
MTTTSEASPLREAPGSKTGKDKVFIPQSPVSFTGGNPAKMLSTQDRAKLLMIFNDTRKGAKTYTVEITYIKQTESEPRIEGADYQTPSGVSPRVHMGQVINAKLSQFGNWYIVLADTLRANQGEQGYSTLRLTGIKSLKVHAVKPGPAVKDAPSPLEGAFQAITPVTEAITPVAAETSVAETFENSTQAVITEVPTEAPVATSTWRDLADLV